MRTVARSHHHHHHHRSSWESLGVCISACKFTTHTAACTTGAQWDNVIEKRNSFVHGWLHALNNCTHINCYVTSRRETWRCRSCTVTVTDGSYRGLREGKVKKDLYVRIQHIMIIFIDVFYTCVKIFTLVLVLTTASNTYDRDIDRYFPSPSLKNYIQCHVYGLWSCFKL